MDSIERTAVSTAWVALDACARTLIFAALAAIAIRVLRITRPAARLQIWSVVLVCAVLMPGLTKGLPEWALPLPSWLAVSAPAAPAAPEQAIRPIVTNTRPPSDRSDTTSTESLITATDVAIPAAPPAAPAVPWSIVAIAIYVGVLAILVFQLVIAWRATRRLVRNAIGIEDSAVVEQFRTCAQAAGLPTAPHLLETPALLVPVTCGILRPSVVLPTNWEEWSSAALRAVFVHELAHVARRDAVRQLLSLIYRALLWINPFSWWLHRRLVDLAEQASDDAAMEAGADRIEYAEMLVGFFRAAAANRSRRVNWGVAMATGASVERRVERIITWRGAGRTRYHGQLGLAVLIPVACLAASAVPVAIAIQPVVSVTTSQPSPIVEPMAPAAPVDSGKVVSERQVESEGFAAPQVATAVPQMTVLVFDLAVPVDTRQRVVAAARRQVDETTTRFSVGLGIGTVWRVTTVGSQIEILQDFTGDNEKVQAALSRAATLTSSSAGNAERIAAVGAMCRAVAALPVNDSYFRDWPRLRQRLEIGTSAPRDFDSTTRRIEYFAATDTLTPDDRRRTEESCKFGNVYFAETFVGASSQTQASPRLIDRLRTRATALVFDGALSDVDRARSLALANRFVEDADPTEAISIALSGANPELLQDFTHDKSLLHAALAKASRSGQLPSPAMAFTSIRRTCTGMSASRDDVLRIVEVPGIGRTPVIMFLAKERVVYFSTAGERGALSPRDLRDIAADCSDESRSFYVLDAKWISPVYGADGPVSAGLRQIGYDLGVGLSVAPRQPGCPLTLATEKTAIDNGYASVLVSNASQKTVGRVTLGLVLTPNDASQMVPKVLLSQGVSMPLQPGERIDIATRLLEGKLFALLARQGALVEVGVVGVDFTDGTKWTYDLETRGRFERAASEPSPAAQQATERRSIRH